MKSPIKCQQKSVNRLIGTTPTGMMASQQAAGSVRLDALRGGLDRGLGSDTTVDTFNLERLHAAKSPEEHVIVCVVGLEKVFA